MQLSRQLLLFLTSLMIAAPQALAWGGRGHDSICEVATYLVKNERLKEFVQFRPQVFGHLCNVPDIYWKSLPKEQTPFGNSAHYINAEAIGLKLSQVPLDFKALSEKYNGQPNLFEKKETIENVAKDVGSIWWRVDQLMGLAAKQAAIIKDAPLPSNKGEEQNEKLPYNSAIYNWMVNIGVMGHFVGDASMPFHNSSDHDGWYAGHGGIHSYYEDAVVGQFDGDLQSLILQRARELQKQPGKTAFLKGSTLEKMQKLSESAAAEIPAVLAADPIIKKSIIKQVEGKEVRIAAERKSPKVGLVQFKKRIIDQMARSSLLLANLWDESYKNLGSPDLSAYRSYRYPFTPEFIGVDYASK